jgi:hypothetical protein
MGRSPIVPRRLRRARKRARCNLLARALFGREVHEDSAELLDADLSAHGYQLWTAAVGTIIETQKRNLPGAVFVVHQFLPRDLDAAAGTGDRRDWATALNENADMFAAFAKALMRAERQATTQSSSTPAPGWICSRSRVPRV